MWYPLIEIVFHFGTFSLAVLEDVGRQAHRRLGRVDVVAARHVLLEHVVLDRAAQLLGGNALLLADQFVEQQQDRGRRVDRHRGRDLVERDLIEADPHVLDRVDRDAGAADLAVAERVVGVAAELSRQVEGHREAGRAVLDQVAVALVGVLGAGEAGVLAHRPEPVPVHAVVDAAGERVGAGLAEPLLQVGGDVAGLVELVDLDPGVGEAALVVGADDRGDGAVLGRVGRVCSRAREDSVRTERPRELHVDSRPDRSRLAHALAGRTTALALDLAPGRRSRAGRASRASVADRAELADRRPARGRRPASSRSNDGAIRRPESGSRSARRCTRNRARSLTPGCTITVSLIDIWAVIIAMPAAIRGRIGTPRPHIRAPNR